MTLHLPDVEYCIIKKYESNNVFERTYTKYPYFNISRAQASTVSLGLARLMVNAVSIGSPA